MQFTLRQKLFFIFAILLLITAFVGIQSLRRLDELGRSIDVILKENYRSVIACEQMKDSLERIDSGVLLILLGYDKVGRTQVLANLPRFDNALKAEMHNLTLPEEPAKADRLNSLYIRFKGMLQPFLNRNSNSLRDSYMKDLMPLFLEIKDAANEILRLNQENMNQANSRARIKATRSRGDMYFLLVSSSLVAGVFFFFSNRWIMKPIRRLIDSTVDIRRGNLNLIIRVDTQDEIGQLSEAFNAMVASLRLFRRSDQEKLLRIQRSTQEAFRNLPEAIALLDLEGRIEVATDSAQRNFGLAPNRKIGDIQIPWLPGLYDDIRQSIQAGSRKEYGFDVIQHFIDHQEKFFRPRAFSLYNDQGDLSGIILILEDVTLSRQSDEIKQNLLATVSHQLKTPLTSILMAFHILLEEKIGTLNEKQADLLVSGRDEGQRLLAIIEDLLEVSRIEGGKVRMNLAAVPPAELVAASLEPFLAVAQEKGIRLASEVPDDLPEVLADRARLCHVFANLISNAIKFTTPGGKVQVKARLKGKKVVFSVADDGRGIPEEYQGRIFEKFFRIPDPDNPAGEGLGLAIAKEIINAHNGQITFSSTSKQGTVFHFTLERADRHEEESPHA